MSLVTKKYAECHVKYIFNLIYVDHYEQKDLFNLLAMLFVANEHEAIRF